jgi:hypothetical protein
MSCINILTSNAFHPKQIAASVKSLCKKKKKKKKKANPETGCGGPQGYRQTDDRWG